MRRKPIYTIIAIGLLSIAAYTVGYLYTALRGNSVSEPIELYISHSDTYDSVRTRIHDVIKYPTAFDIYASHLDLKERFKPGYYRIEPEENVIGIVRRICLGSQTPVMMTIGYCRNSSMLAENIARYIEASREDVEHTLKDQKAIDSMDMGCDSLFAMFIPNTYEVRWSDSAESIVRRLKHEASAFWNASRKEKLKQIGLTRLEATVLASIVNEESSIPKDRRTIAGVYMNRLHIGMPLQACPTIIYAHQDFSIRRVRREQLKIDSPYNTYIHTGLPPTPICMPEISSIDAVLDYDHNSYLYFAADAEHPGRTVFSSSYGEHMRNGNKWKKKLNKLNIRK